MRSAHAPESLGVASPIAGSLLALFAAVLTRLLANAPPLLAVVYAVLLFVSAKSDGDLIFEHVCDSAEGGGG